MKQGAGHRKSVPTVITFHRQLAGVEVMRCRSQGQWQEAMAPPFRNGSLIGLDRRKCQMTQDGLGLGLGRTRRKEQEEGSPASVDGARSPRAD